MKVVYLDIRLDPQGEISKELMIYDQEEEDRGDN